MTETSKLVLRCSQKGEILSVEHQLGLWTQVETLTNKNYVILVAASSVAQASTFWKQVLTYGAIFNREITCSIDSQNRLFSGIILGESVILSVTDFQPDMADFLKEIMHINTAQHNAIRSMHQTAKMEPKNDHELYQEISRINNELMNTERQLQNVNSKLNHKTELLELINKILRHDLMNIFSVLRSGLRLYSQDHDEELLTSISSRMKDGIQLINDMRAMDTLDKSSVTAFDRYSPYSIQAYLTKNFPQLAITVSGEADIIADSFVYSAFSNLASNALRHGKATEISIECKNTDKATEVQFCDNGTGIPKEIQEKIFELNFIYGKTGHTGMGLYILSQIMKRYRGTVQVQDNPQGGACFRMIFPHHRVHYETNEEL